MTKLTLFIFLIILCNSCSEKEKGKAVHQAKSNKEKVEKYIFGNRFEIEGDFNGDGIVEKLTEHYFDSLTHKEVPKFIEDMEDAERTTKISPFSFMISDNDKIDTLLIASGPQVSGVLFMKNEGDLNGDRTDEISYVIHWADWSSSNTWHITTFKNNKWVELLTFPISEWQLDNITEKNNSWVKKLGNKKIQIIFRNDEGEEQTKTITLK
jgi:hypothetical protein